MVGVVVEIVGVVGELRVVGVVEIGEKENAQVTDFKSKSIYTYTLTLSSVLSPPTSSLPPAPSSDQSV